MSISKKEVQHIAKLARLGLKEKEIEKMKKELSLILDYFDLLKEVDVSKIKPTFYSIKESKRISVREDRIEKNKNAKRLLDLAPERKGDFIKVKEIFKS